MEIRCLEGGHAPVAAESAVNAGPGHGAIPLPHPGISVTVMADCRPIMDKGYPLWKYWK